MNTVAWLVGLGTAVWFGAVAAKAGRNWLSWAVAGGLFGLIVSVIILGLAQAASVPVSYQAVVKLKLESISASVLVVGLIGALVTWRLLATRARTKDEKSEAASASPA